MAAEKEILESALLVVRWQRGDRAAFEEIVRRWEQPLFYYLRRLAPSEADAWELLQETWLKLFRSLGKLRDPRTLPAFMYTTARNTAISRLRGQDFQQPDEHSPEACDAAAGDDIAAFENAEQVHHALDRIPLRQREALTLYFLHDLSLEEMAEVLEAPVGTVKSRLYYGKLAMREILEKGDGHVQ